MTGTIRREPEREKGLYDVLRESFVRTERTGIHLTSCLEPRLHYWSRLKPQPLTDAEIGYFAAGRGHEDAVGKLLVEDFVETPEEEIDGIHLRPDFQAVTNRIIPKDEFAEFKTRRSNLPKTDEEAATVFESYRDQIQGYMALKDRFEMYLIVLSLLEGKDRKDPLSTSKPVFAVYKETMTRPELVAKRSDLLARRQLVEKENPKVMPLCAAWKCVRNVKTPSGWQRVAACKWHRDCRPDLVDPQRECK